MGARVLTLPTLLPERVGDPGSLDDDVDRTRSRWFPDTSSRWLKSAIRIGFLFFSVRKGVD